MKEKFDPERCKENSRRNRKIRIKKSFSVPGRAKPRPSPRAPPEFNRKVNEKKG